MMMRDFYLLLLLFKIKAESKCNLLLISRRNNDLTGVFFYFGPNKNQWCRKGVT